jgi:hypothetical protein
MNLSSLQSSSPFSKSFTRTFHSNDRHDENEARDDDEFIFPVQFISNSEIQYHWSGAELSKDGFDFNTSDFLPEKTVIYNQKKLKVVQVSHKTEGVMTFTLIQDRQKLWKICNIFKFGYDLNLSDYQETLGVEPIKKELFLNFLKEINPLQFKGIQTPPLPPPQQLQQSERQEIPFLSLTRPYQFIQPPYSLKNKDKISSYFQLPYANTMLEYLTAAPASATSKVSSSSDVPETEITKAEDDYDYQEAEVEGESESPAKVLLSSPNQVLLETHLQVKDSQGTVLSIIDLLLLIVNASGATPEKERIACVMIGGEQKIRRPR